VIALASFRGYKAEADRFMKLRLNKNYHRSVEKSDYFLLMFDQEIRYLEDFSLRVLGDGDGASLCIKDEDLVQELKDVKKVSVALLEKDYSQLQSSQCPYEGYSVYWQGDLLGKVIGYSGSSQLPILEIDMQGKTLLLPEVDDYLDSIEEQSLHVKNVEDLLELCE